MKLKKMDIDGILFDLDGTLWNSTEQIRQAWNMELQKHPEVARKTVTTQDLAHCMGLPMYEIAARLFPEETTQKQREIMNALCEFENGYLAEQGGILYPQLKETLAVLSGRYPLFIVSNCQDGYIEAFLHAHRLQTYFRDTECWGRTRVSKGQSNLILMRRNGLQCPIYVGDTQGDADSAQEAGIPFVFASYGFGEVPDAKTEIKSFSDLQILVDE